MSGASEIMNSVLSNLGEEPVSTDTANQDPVNSDPASSAAGGNDPVPESPAVTDPEGEQPDPAADPADPANPPAEGQDPIVDKAVKSLGKVLGKDLKPEEAMQELAKSHLNADQKIHALQDQIQEFIPYRQLCEQIVEHPQYERIRAILDGKEPDSVPPEGNDPGWPDEGELPPAVSKEMKEMREQIRQLQAEKNQESTAAFKEKVAENRRQIEAFSKKEGNEEFKTLLESYWQNAKINPFVSMPEKLKKFAALVDTGIGLDEAWAALNPQALIDRTNRHIAGEQRKKPVLPNTRGSKPPVAPNLEDLDDIGEIVRAAAKKVRG